MLEVQLEPELETLLDEQAQLAGETRAEFVRRAIVDRLEDREDYEIAIAALNDARGVAPIPLEEVVKSLGMESEFSSQGREAAQEPGRNNAEAHSEVSVRKASRIA